MRHFLPQDDRLSELSVIAVENSPCYCYILIQSTLSSKTPRADLTDRLQGLFQYTVLAGTLGRSRPTAFIPLPSEFRMSDNMAGWWGGSFFSKKSLTRAANIDRGNLQCGILEIEAQRTACLHCQLLILFHIAIQTNKNLAHGNGYWIVHVGINNSLALRISKFLLSSGSHGQEREKTLNWSHKLKLMIIKCFDNYKHYIVATH